MSYEALVDNQRQIELDSYWSPSNDLENGTRLTSSVELQFKNLSYTLNLGDKKKEKVILRNVSGVARGGKVNAIFGPTGAGKSTLLDCLARRKKESWITGDGVFVNGTKQKSSFKRMSGYVVQDDILLYNMTVRENITFSARLRLPHDLYSAADRERLVELVIQELGLQKCADSLIGNDLLRGISGGEKKRTNIACELVIRYVFFACASAQPLTFV